MSGSTSIRPIASRLPTMIPHCGPPSSLSPEKSTRSAPAASASAAVGSSSMPGRTARPNRPGADVVDRPEPVRVRELDQLRELGLLGEPDDPEVAGMDAEDGGGFGPDGPAIIGQPGLVGRADLAQPCPETSKISGSRKLPPISTSWPRETITSRPAASARSASTVGAGVVVHDRRRLGAGQLAEQCGDPGGPPPPRSVAEVELQVAVSGGDLRDRLDRLRGQRGPAQPGVEQHAGRVDHRSQRSPLATRGSPAHERDVSRIDRLGLALLRVPSSARRCTSLTARRTATRPCRRMGSASSLVVQDRIHRRQPATPIRLAQALAPVSDQNGSGSEDDSDRWDPGHSGRS